MRMAARSSPIGLEAARSSHLSRRFPSAGSRNPCRRERNFWMQRPEAQNPPERPFLSAETGNVENRRKISAETASFRSTTVSAVREDWMVVCAVRYEPVSEGKKYREKPTDVGRPSEIRQRSPAVTWRLGHFPVISLFFVSHSL